MMPEQPIAVRRPARWTQPLDPSMTDADVAWLRSRTPFADMDASALPRSLPIESIIRGDTRLLRCQPGEMIVREGDYGNSAFLVLAGQARVLLDSLDPHALGRDQDAGQDTGKSNFQAFWRYAGRYFGRGPLVESRRPQQVTTHLDADGSAARPTSIQQVDTRQAIFLQDFAAILKGVNTVSIGPGELFGEVAAMYRSPRTATVLAQTEATLLEIRWQGLRLLRRDPKFADTLERHYRDHWLGIHLRETPLLRHLPDRNLRRVTAATQLRSFGRMEWNADYKKNRKLPVEQQIASEPLVAGEGATATDLILVRSGFGRLSQAFGASERTTAYLGRGHLFGLDEIAASCVRPASQPPLPLQNSLRAVGFLDTLHIPVEVFASDILPYVRRSELPPEAARWLTDDTSPRARSLMGGLTSKLVSIVRLRSTSRGQDHHQERRITARRDSNATSAARDVSSPDGQRFQQTGLMEFIVQNRLNNGQQAMVIDLHRCTRCDDCVTACAATHDGNSRFIRQGVSHDRLQFAQACMQCDDPVCMIGCPTGAITRSGETGVVGIHESICVGCGLCAASCPYDNISMVFVQDPNGRPYTDVASGRPIQKATKCDMCQHSPTGPACVSACPHDALVRIDLTQSAPLRQWLQQRGEP